jgi:hypothetical protein
VIETISVRDEYLRINDEGMLEHILAVLREDFLFLLGEDFTIEVHEQDVEPVRERLIEIKKQLQEGQ